MRQVWIARAGPPDTLEVREAADPVPRVGEVRIRVEASGVNFADILGRMGLYKGGPPIPYVPGYEVAGVIDAIGQGVPDLREGDKVFAATRFGGYTDVACVPHLQVFKRLDWMTVEDAAALPVNYLTAYIALLVMGSLRPGDRVLIHSAAGGVGLAAVDICRIVGAEAIGTASPHKHSFLLERGLKHVIDYRNEDYERAVMDLTAGKGVNLVLEAMGGIHWVKNYRLLMPTGRLVHFGISSAAPGKTRSLLAVARMLVQLPFYHPIKLMNDNRAVMGVNLNNLWEQMDMMRDWMRQIVAWYDEALFRPHIHRTFRFSKAAEAHHIIQDRKNIGKVLLIP
ncbi:MAG: medium chain dehydrogenase/reductase family protein [Anaerolineae bacterium]